jgi:hypothetical protein
MNHHVVSIGMCIIAPLTVTALCESASAASQHAVIVRLQTTDAVEVLSEIDPEIDPEVDSKVDLDHWRWPGPLVDAAGLSIGTGSFSNLPINPAGPALAASGSLQVPSPLTVLDPAFAVGDARLNSQFGSMRLELRDSSILLSRPAVHNAPAPAAASVLLVMAIGCAGRRRA